MRSTFFTVLASFACLQQEVQCIRQLLNQHQVGGIDAGLDELLAQTDADSSVGNLGGETTQSAPAINLIDNNRSMMTVGMQHMMP